MLATYMWRVRNNNLEIRFVGSSCRPQKLYWIRPRAGGWCDCSGGSTGGGPRGPAPPLIIFWRPGPLLISGSGLPAPHFSEGLDLPLDRYHICLSFLKWSSLKRTHVVCKKVTDLSSQKKHLWYVNVYRLNNQVFSSLFKPLISSKL